MSKYKYGRKNWKSLDSKYSYSPPYQLDKDVRENLKRYNNKKKHIEELFLNEIKNDPARQDETFSMFIDILREWKLNN